jgi:hypothetical protein
MLWKTKPTVTLISPRLATPPANARRISPRLSTPARPTYRAPVPDLACHCGADLDVDECGILTCPDCEDDA